MEKNPEKAINLLTQAIKINPNDAGHYGSRGVAYMLLQNPKKALEDYNKAISISKNESWLYSNRGAAYWHLGNITKAKVDAKKACSLGDCELKKEIKKQEKQSTPDVAVEVEYNQDSNNWTYQL